MNARIARPPANMPQVFVIADRVHIMRLGRRVATITPQTHTMAEAVALMTGAVSAAPLP